LWSSLFIDPFVTPSSSSPPLGQNAKQLIGRATSSPEASKTLCLGCALLVLDRLPLEPLKHKKSNNLFYSKKKKNIKKRYK
jgi:hypothetical protein